MEYEENNKNPTISQGVKVNIKHLFEIRYKDDKIKEKMVNFVLKLVKEHEISDFLIEEKQAFNIDRVIYNSHTLASDKDDLSYERVRSEFLKRQ